MHGEEQTFDSGPGAGAGARRISFWKRMKSNRQRRSYVLVAIGLLGISLYAAAVRVWHPDFLSSDIIRGVWYGICIGPEIIGVYLLRESKPTA